ncbi:MAG: hypothetical protein IPM47_01440 [Sphingobacteriales bacterium]|nr:MAG: hypothetical protein IPM47_01440 [Sphingobacteriales bacterium]
MKKLTFQSFASLPFLILLFVSYAFPLMAQPNQTGNTVKTATTRQVPTTPPVADTPPPADTTLLLPMPELPKIEVTEAFETVSGRQGPAMKVNIPSADPISVEKSWVKYLKNFGGKTKGGKAEYVSENAYIRGVSEDPVKIYSKTEGYANGTMVKMMVDMGGNNFVNPKTDVDKFALISKMLTSFAISESVKGISTKLNEEERNLLNLDGERDAQKNTEKEILDEIIQLRAALERAEAKLSDNKDEQNKLNLDIKKQINTIEFLRNSLKSISQQ